MAGTTLTKTGLVKHAFGAANWHSEQAQGFQDFENRIGLSSNGTPQGGVAGSWYGQTCLDLSTNIFWECIQPGTTPALTVWQQRSADEPGTFKTFVRANLPSGWLLCDGSTRTQADYPALFAVLHAGLKSGTNFTLPDLMSEEGIVLGLGYPSATLLGSGQTDEDGDHNHEGTTDGHVLSEGETPYAFAGTSSSSSTPNDQGRVTRRTADAHWHDFSTDGSGTHTHAVDPRRMQVLPGVKF